jgi:hypothetical protein
VGIGLEVVHLVIVIRLVAQASQTVQERADIPPIGVRAVPELLVNVLVSAFSLKPGRRVLAAEIVERCLERSIENPADR